MLNKSEDGSGPGQGTSAGYEITDGHCVSQPGNTTNKKYLEEDETSTGKVPSGRGWRKIGRCGSSMLRPSHNNGTVWLHNDDNNDDGVWGGKGSCC